MSLIMDAMGVSEDAQRRHFQSQRELTLKFVANGATNEDLDQVNAMHSCYSEEYGVDADLDND